MVYFYLLMFVQICTESLPVSSSGHIILLNRVLSFLSPSLAKCIFIESHCQTWNSFLHLFHLNTVIILLLFFFNRWFSVLRDWKRTWPQVVKLFFLILVTDTITFFSYLFVKQFNYFSGSLSICFLITVVLLFSMYYQSSTTNHSFSFSDALLFGLLQSIALLPGISRFALVVVGACWLGYSKQRAFELTWLLQLPLIVGASLRGAYQLYTKQLLWCFFSLTSIMIMIVITILGYYLLSFAYRLLVNNNFWLFGWYMILPFLLSVII